MRILIFGGSGGLGSVLAKRLSKQGHGVTIFSRHRADERVVLRDRGRVSWVQGDVRRKSDVKRAFANERWDCVVHLAALLQHACRADPVEAVRVNVVGTENILEAARHVEVGRFVFGSSIAVYGSYKGLLRENGSIASDVSIYGLTKLLGERLCEAYEAESGVPAVALRYCGIYGGGEPGSRGMAWVRWQIEETIAGKSVEIQQASGDEHCQLTHISDAVEATSYIMMHPAPTYRVYNVAAGAENYITLREFHSRIKQVVPSAGDISFNGHGPDMSPVSTCRLRELGFHVNYDIENGVNLLAKSRM